MKFEFETKKDGSARLVIEGDAKEVMVIRELVESKMHEIVSGIKKATKEVME